MRLSLSRAGGAAPQFFEALDVRENVGDDGTVVAGRTIKHQRCRADETEETMTEQQKPELGEVSDEQLENVAGGSDAIQNVSRLQAPIVGDVAPPQPAGELQMYDSTSPEFAGDGTTTPKTILQRDKG